MVYPIPTVRQEAPSSFSRFYSLVGTEQLPLMVHIYGALYGGP